jgi:hypothetical protein
MAERYATGWSDPRVMMMYGGLPKWQYQIRYSFGLDGKTKRGYTVVKYDVVRTFLPEEMLAQGLTYAEAVGFEKLLKEE